MLHFGNKTKFKTSTVLKKFYMSFHWDTGGPNISMVSRTRERWSRNELTETLRIRASSARHLLKHHSRSSAEDTQKRFIVKGGTEGGSHTESVLPDSVSCFSMPPFLGSLSGDRERRAMAASRGEGKGTSRELGRAQGQTYHSRTGPAVFVVVFFFYLVYSASTRGNNSLTLIGTSVQSVHSLTKTSPSGCNNSALFFNCGIWHAC